MRRNPYTLQAFHTQAPPDLQVAADMALEGLTRDPNNIGFFWVKPLLQGNPIGVDLLVGSGAALAKAGGDLAKLDPTLIPDGGVVCPAGSFIMGSPENEPSRFEEESQHRVTLTRPFALGKYPVTQGLYTAVMGKNPSLFADVDEASRRPVERVSWYDAVRFCNRLSEMLGLETVHTITGPGEKPDDSWDPRRNGFRLPSEAEWEYAARSGEDTFRYAGSDDLDEVGWYSGNSGRSTHPVGQKKPNRWGLHDMSGNVREWVQDLYDDYPGDTIDYVKTHSAARRVLRGGSWCTFPSGLRVALRFASHAPDRDKSFGFRICRTLPAVKPNPRWRRR